jgi:Zn ribbon nucleic-acid-binding protein
MVKCDQCESENVMLARRWLPLHVYECLDCGHQFRSKPPPVAEDEDED